MNRYKVMLICTEKRSSKYTLMGSEVAVTGPERDLGVTVSGLMKMLSQCEAAVEKVDSVPGEGTENKMAARMPLYRSVVQPHLECCAQIWLLCLWRLQLDFHTRAMLTTDHFLFALFYYLHFVCCFLYL